MILLGQKEIKKRRGLVVPSPAILAALAALAPAVAQAQTQDSNGTVQLGPIKVEDESDKALSHGTGLSTMPYSVQDTPQAITVIGQEQLQEQGVTSLEQALRNVPGITITIGEAGNLNGDQFKIRGFDAKDDVYIDGLRDFGVYTRDSFNYEEVQVLKGPSGAMFGRGTTGGAINTQSKTPQLEDFGSADAFLGNGPYYRALGDVNYQIGDHSALRVTGMLNATHVEDRDMVKSDRWGIAPTLALGLGTDTKFILGYLHQHDDRFPDYGITIVQPPGSLIAEPASEYGVPRSNMLGYSTDVDRTNADILTARLSHQATPWLTLNSDSRLGLYSRYFQFTTVDRCDGTSATAFCNTKFFGSTPTTAEGGIGGQGPYFQRSWGVQNISTARAKFPIGDWKNEAIVGADLSYQHNAKTLYAYTLPSTSIFTYTLGNGTASRANIGRNLFNPVHTPPPGYVAFVPTLATIANSTATATSVVYTTGESSDFGFFLTDRLWFDDAWSVIGSVRFDQFNSQFDTITVSNIAARLQSDSSLTNPRVSLVYEPNENQTFYFSYGKSATPQGASVVGAATAIALTTKDLEPEISDTYELGAKYGFFDGKLSATGSIFKVTKNNATQTDPNTGFLLAQSGEKQEVRGFELGVTGNLVEGWSLSAGFTHLDAQIRESFSTCATLTSTSASGVACPTGVPVGTSVLNTAIIGRQVVFVPRNAASFWTNYEADSLVPGLSFGGGVTYQSKVPVGYTVLSPLGAPAVIRYAQVPDSTTIDAVVAYRAGPYRVALNGYNLTNELGYTQLWSNRGVPTPGTTFILSVGRSF